MRLQCNRWVADLWKLKREFESRSGNQGESMKRAAIIIAVLGIAVWSFVQNGFAQSNDKPAA